MDNEIVMVHELIQKIKEASTLLDECYEILTKKRALHKNQFDYEPSTNGVDEGNNRDSVMEIHKHLLSTNYDAYKELAK